jgi:CO/xanthine dehydrogenase Mo-binding subunit
MGKVMGKVMGASPAASPFRYIGHKRRTKEDPRFVTGRGRFVADIALDNMKHAAIVTSPHASARIRAIRTAAALAAKGGHRAAADRRGRAEGEALSARPWRRALCG